MARRGSADGKSSNLMGPFVVCPTVSLFASQGCHRFGCGLNKVVSVQAILLAMMFPNEGSAWGPYLILLRHHLGVELNQQSQPA